jgi:hypothetical protein
MTTPNEVTPEAQAQLRKALDTALNKPNQAQGFLNKIPDLSAVGPKVNDVLDDVLGAIDVIQQYNWLLGKYADPLQKFEDALRKVKGWIS